MIDPSTLIPLVSPVVAAVVAFIKTQGAQKAGEKALKADAKAQQALVNLEQDPDDEDYQQKLVKETARLASTDSTFAQDIKVLAENVAIAQSGSVAIDNKASNFGAQGVFNAPIQFDNRKINDNE